jgi:hypothetical protein
MVKKRRKREVIRSVPFARVGEHVDRVRHETADGTEVRVAVRLQDDPEIGTLAALDVDGPEELALMALWHFYIFPRVKSSAALIILCFQ